MKRVNIALLILSALITASCTDFDNGLTEAEIRYNQNFIDQFGNIDPNQDWNMARQYTATVDLDAEINGTLTIYTAAPTVYGSQLLARTTVEDGEAKVKFDAVKGTASFYARIEEEGTVIHSGTYLPDEKGVLFIGKAKTNTRSLYGGTCPVTRETYDAQVRHMKPEVIQAFRSSNAETYSAYNALPGTTIPAYGMFQNDVNCSTLENVPRLYQLKGVDFTLHDDGYTTEELTPIFGTYTNMYGETKGGVFQEGIDHIDQYVREGTLTTDVTFYVKEDGPVILDVIWRGTQYADFFGYYYYNDEDLKSEDWWNNIDKYILINNQDENSTVNWIQAKTSLTQRSTWNSGTSTYGDWENLDGMGTANFGNSWNSKDKVRGTKLMLVNFDDPASPTYNFKAGTKVGFFFCDKSNVGYKFYLSDTDLDYELFLHTYKSTDLGKEGRPFAAKFGYDGRSYIGFGDESGDCDLNDIVLIASNVWPPATDITPQDLPEPDEASWIVACEDLGATDDIDFNDVVFKVSHVGGEQMLRVTPLAAGGILASDLYFGDHNLGEIHQLLGSPAKETGSYGFINTESTSRGTVGAPITIGNSDKYTIQENISAEFSMANDVAGIISLTKESIEDFKIVTHYSSTSSDNAESTIRSFSYGDQGIGKVPQMICVPALYVRPTAVDGKVEKGDWPWPTERTNIATAYNVTGHRFVDWVGAANNVDWYNYFSPSAVVAGTKAEVNENTGKVDNPSGGNDSKTAVSFNGLTNQICAAGGNNVTLNNITLKDEDGTVLTGNLYNNEYFKVETSDEEIAVATYNYQSINVTPGQKSGIANIVVEYIGNETYKPAKAYFTVTVSPKPHVVFGGLVDRTLKTTDTGKNGYSFTSSTDGYNPQSVTMTSSNESVATIEYYNNSMYDIEVKGVVGTATITVTHAETNTLAQTQETFTVEVVEPGQGGDGGDDTEIDLTSQNPSRNRTGSYSADHDYCYTYSLAGIDWTGVTAAKIHVELNNQATFSIQQEETWTGMVWNISETDYTSGDLFNTLSSLSKFTINTANSPLSIKKVSIIVTKPSSARKRKTTRK